jgi:hypothetical protein
LYFRLSYSKSLRWVWEVGKRAQRGVAADQQKHNADCSGKSSTGLSQSTVAPQTQSRRLPASSCSPAGMAGETRAETFGDDLKR